MASTLTIISWVQWRIASYKVKYNYHMVKRFGLKQINSQVCALYQ